MRERKQAANPESLKGTLEFFLTLFELRRSVELFEELLDFAQPLLHLHEAIYFLKCPGAKIYITILSGTSEGRKVLCEFRDIVQDCRWEGAIRLNVRIQVDYCA
jgi:hypothetical protein